jgi:tetratricopeptide (TPR) repeat protein
VQRCDSCGYCAPAIGEAFPGAREVVDSVTYRDVLERSKLPRVARSLFCAALVAEAAGRLESSAWRFLEAAWACDDKSADRQARICRERAAEMFAKALELGETEPPDGVVHTLIAEIWRRCGRFDDALAACAAAEAELGSTVATDDEDGEDERSGAAAVVAYIRTLAIAGEDDCRNCAEAFDHDE